MYLYDILPENLFSILASKNKGLYVNTLFVLLDAFKQHLRISKDELVSMIVSKLEYDIFYADFSEDELYENEQSLSGKAHFLIRKLKSAGWILVEIENDFREYVTVPGFSYRIIQLLSDIANASDTENFAYVYSTYSSLKNADETRNTYEMITALNDSADRTEKLVESLKSLYHSITYYNQQLIDTADVNSVLHSHYDIYQKEIVERVLKPLKIRDSVPKYKIPIQIILKKWLIEENTVNEIVKYMSVSKNTDPEKCRNDILKKIHYIIDTYDGIEKDFIKEVDKKNTQYTRSTAQKINYIINSDQSVRGNLITILHLLSDNKSSDRTYELISDTFEIYDLSFISDESLYSRKRPIKREKTSELIMSADTAEFKANAQKMANEIMSRKFSRKNVSAFVEALLEGKNEISTNEIEIRDDNDYIMTLLSVVYADDKDSKFNINFQDGFVKNGNYKIPLMIYRRKYSVS